MIIPSVVNVLSPITNSKNIQRESVDRSDTDATNFSVTEKRTKKRRLHCEKKSHEEDIEAWQYKFKMQRDQLEKLQHFVECR